MDATNMKLMPIRRKGKDQIEPVYNLLSNGTCSNCGYKMKIVEDDWTTFDNKLHKIHRGEHFYKCPGCGELVLIE